MAGGFEIALACDLIVAARDARFGIPEVKRGLVAAGGALLRLPQRIPYHVAMELALTGDPIDAERALRARHRQPARRARRGARRRARAGRARSPPTARSRSPRPSGSSARARLAEAEAWDAPGARSPAPVFGSEDAREGADGVRREARAGLAAAASAARR